MQGFSRRLVAALAAVSLSGCLTTSTPLIPPPPAPPRTIAVAVVAQDQNGQAIAGATVGIGAQSAVANADGYHYFLDVPICVVDVACRLAVHVDAPGFAAYDGRYFTGPGTPDFVIRLERNVPVLANAGETGRLHVDGILFRREDGSAYQWRGADAFILFGRFLAGEDIQPFLTDVICAGTPLGLTCDPVKFPGANLIRVFGTLASFGGWDTAPLTAHIFPQEHGDYDEQLGAFIDLVGSRGLRIEFTVFADAQIVMPSGPDQRAHLDRVVAVLRPKWNAVLELANEFEKNGVYPAEFRKPDGMVSAAGSGLGDGAPFLPPWDYVPHHGRRSDEWPRDAKGSGDLCCLGWSTEHPVLRIPIVQDEPMGAGETAGSRSNVPADFRYFGALAAMWGGATFHSDAGILAEVMGPIQREAARELFTAMAFVPAEAPNWPYQRGDQNSAAGVGNMPIAHDDNQELRSFCKGANGFEYCVQIRTTRASATARDGWIIAAEPSHGLVRLVR